MRAQTAKCSRERSIGPNQRPRRSRATLQALQPTTQNEQPKDVISFTTEIPTPLASRSRIDESTHHDPRGETRISDVREGSLARPHPVEQRSSFLSNNSINLEGSSIRPPPMIDSEEVLPDDSSLSYIGDRRGPRFFVYDLCQTAGSPQDAKPYLNPRKSDISWTPHEVEYLRRQGAFTTFSDDVCDDLIRCYFCHVHFFLPVVDAASFLSEYNTGRQNISLLLFWSVLLAAANFVEADVLKRAGFASRKAMKTAIYTRTKCLYDLDRGTEKLVLIQSVILMAFWYTDAQDHTGAWYWIGIAISLSQTIGLHRRPLLNHRSQQLPETQQPLIRRIWWSCVVRDRWISLAKGRPMRIHHEDCDILMPTAEDIIVNLRAVPTEARDKFVPPEFETLSKMWINLVEISSALGRILRIHYRVSGSKVTAEDIYNSAEDLGYCKPRGLQQNNASELLRLHAFHLDLFYEGTAAVLYRPYVLSGPSAQLFEVQPSVQRMALDQARATASNTNSILETMIGLGMIDRLKPMMINTIIPAMQIHLFDCKSTDSLRRGLGTNKLNLCMLVLSQLRDTYWSASVTYRLFARAQELLDKTKSSDIAQLENSTSSPQLKNMLSGNQDTSSYYHQQDQVRSQPYIEQRRPQANTGESTRVMPDMAVVMGEQPVPSWMMDSPYFSNGVDQLLSPGFTLPESSFPSLYTDVDGNLYDPHMHMSGDVPMHILYHHGMP